MKLSTFGAVGLLAIFSAATASSAVGPLEDQPGMERVRLLCSVGADHVSTNCRYYEPVDGNSERLKAGAILGYLDAHGLPLPDAVAAKDVKVEVRLAVKASPDHKGFEVSEPPGTFVAPSGSVIADAVWIVSPHDRSWGAYIPDKVARMNQAGQATAHCVATAKGALVNCWVQDETPSDFGFAEAAFQILQRARMRPTAADGAQIVGRPYVQTFRYNARSGHDPGAFTPVWAH